MAIAIVERSKQESMYGLSPRTKKVAIVEGWLLWRGSCYWRFNCINPFAPGDFAEKRILKLVEWFSGHCRAIKS